MYTDCLEKTHRPACLVPLLAGLRIFVDTHKYIDSLCMSSVLWNILLTVIVSILQLTVNLLWVVITFALWGLQFILNLTQVNEEMQRCGRLCYSVTNGTRVRKVCTVSRNPKIEREPKVQKECIEKFGFSVITLVLKFQLFCTFV